MRPCLENSHVNDIASHVKSSVSFFYDTPSSLSLLMCSSSKNTISIAISALVRSFVRGIRAAQPEWHTERLSSTGKCLEGSRPRPNLMNAAINIHRQKQWQCFETVARSPRINRQDSEKPPLMIKAASSAAPASPRPRCKAFNHVDSPACAQLLISHAVYLTGAPLDEPTGASRKLDAFFFFFLWSSLRFPLPGDNF